VDPAALELLASREESLGLLRLDGLVDLIIPRGSNALVRFIQDNTRIPVLGHADGICHLYVDAAADAALALRVALDSKTQYPAACNAIETLLVHQAIAPAFVPQAVAAFAAAGVELRGDAAAMALGVCLGATDDDWSCEYSDLILAVKVVAMRLLVRANNPMAGLAHPVVVRRAYTAVYFLQPDSMTRQFPELGVPGTMVGTLLPLPTPTRTTTTIRMLAAAAAVRETQEVTPRCSMQVEAPASGEIPELLQAPMFAARAEKADQVSSTPPIRRQ